MCEQALSSDWSTRAQHRIAEATSTAKTVRAARRETKAKLDDLRARLRPVPRS